jgi:hypothetical protein
LFFCRNAAVRSQPRLIAGQLQCWCCSWVEVAKQQLLRVIPTRSCSTLHVKFADGDSDIIFVSRNYHGHLVNHLKVVRDALASQGKKSFVYLMGDSSLDNKYDPRSLYGAK